MLHDEPLRLFKSLRPQDDSKINESDRIVQLLRIEVTELAQVTKRLRHWLRRARRATGVGGAVINSLLSCPGLTGASSTPRRSFCIPLTISALEYWVARSSRATTGSGNQKGGRRARRFTKTISGNAGCPGGAGLHPGLKATSSTLPSSTSSPSSPSSLS